MNKGLCAALSAGVLLILLPALVLAWNFDYEIYSAPGGILENSPVIYEGVLTSGGDGTVTITLDDTGWPDPSTPLARFDHIWATYFAANYDTSGGTGSFRWIGELLGRFAINSANAPGNYNGYCTGSIIAEITVRDFNENGQLDRWERDDKQHLFDGRLSKMCEDFSMGGMALTRGFGSINSNYFSFFPRLYPPGSPSPTGVDTLYNGAQLTLYWGMCGTPTETPSWGAIKALYR